MSTPVYTPQELQGKYIVCFVLISGKRPVLDCVRYTSAYREGKPYLYDSIDQAKKDKFFDPDNDEIVLAEEYFRRLQQEKSEVSKP